jgi:hypothetical protein
MEDIFPFLIGFSGKIIDDNDDQKLNLNQVLIQSLQSLNVCLFTLTSKDDFLFSFSTLILSIFGAGVDTYYWKSFILISIFLSIHYFSPVDNWPLFILIITVIIISTHLEENSFPEEYSIKKLISRVLGLIVFSGVLILPPILLKKYDIVISTPNITYIRKLILIGLGGIVDSIFSQLFFLFYSNQV